MTQPLHQLLDRLQQVRPDVLQDMQRGIEKEGLRADAQGRIAQTDHPQGLGSALTHPDITTDYSEALLELITPVDTDVDHLLGNLRDTHRFMHSLLPVGETMWAASMPCRLDGDASIRIAEYGSSNLGTIKHVYRRGLAHRYGRIMQSIAGVHFNFSMGDRFWDTLYGLSEQSQSLQDFKSDAYFNLIRNFRRWSWLLMYLYGASPALDKSFLDGRPSRLPLESLGQDTLGLPYATSLRMSGLGYQNNAQASLKICFNHLDSYLKTLYDAIHIPYPPYEKIGLKRDGEYLQLNTNLLQIENEYYNSIRPKRVSASGEKPIQSLQRRGIEYLEVRCLDLDPFSPIGVERSQIYLLDAFLITCLLESSPTIDDEECGLIDQNFSAVVERGRSPDCLLSRMVGQAEGAPQYQQLSLQDWAYELLDKVESVAAVLDNGNPAKEYRQAVATARTLVEDSRLTPSARTLDLLSSRRQGYADLVLGLSQAHQQQLLAATLSPEELQRTQRISEQSWLDERALRESDTLSFDDYLRQYLSYE